jgi:hypothetical protein
MLRDYINFLLAAPSSNMYLQYCTCIPDWIKLNRIHFPEKRSSGINSHWCNVKRLNWFQICQRFIKKGK